MYVRGVSRSLICAVLCVWWHTDHLRVENHCLDSVCVCVCASLLEGAILLFGLTLLLHPFLWSPLPHCPLRTSRDAVAHNLNHFLLIPFPISYILAILLIIIFFCRFYFSCAAHSHSGAAHNILWAVPCVGNATFFFWGRLV